MSSSADILNAGIPIVGDQEAKKTNAADDYRPVPVIAAQPGYKRRALQVGA
ncbi:MAG: hypothetical protein NUV55_13710 [Sulfuricaulis sp.]|uniref:hypothetical protein n=1 Tax=Sulfuricaulis sp. TaxID=2003553 RepID=UPI0025EA2930|nr:hypothetical protein [Sulfuricaulis sp.]MCR4348237.1 hypothetical protein [Sulfuricaulis sp.]